MDAIISQMTTHQRSVERTRLLGRLRALRSEDRVEAIQNEQKTIAEQMARTYDETLGALHERYQKLQRELGALLLARDRVQRPHIYR